MAHTPIKHILNHHLVFVVMAAAVGSGFQHGYHSGVLNVPEKSLIEWVDGSYRNRTGTEMGTENLGLIWVVITSIMSVGGTIGAILSGFVANWLGPRTGLLLNNSVLLVANVLLIGAPYWYSYEAFAVGRFLVGINCGLSSGLCPLYLSEIAPLSHRGGVSSMYQLMITIGILTSNASGLLDLLSISVNLAFLFLAPVVIGLIQVVMLPFCPESPSYLLNVKRNKFKAEQALIFLHMRNDVQHEMEDLLKENEHIQSSSKVTFSEMFHNRNLRVPLIISITIMVAQQLCGIDCVIFYSTQIFTQANFNRQVAQLGTTVVGIVKVLMTIVSVFAVDTSGRKTLLIFGFAGMAIDSFMLAVVLAYTDRDPTVKYLGILLVFIYISLFAGGGVGSIPWFIETELFNHAARAKAVSLAVPCNWITKCVVTALYPHLQTHLSSWVFMLFVPLDVVFLTFIIKFVPETKNKTIEDITSQF